MTSIETGLLGTRPRGPAAAASLPGGRPAALATQAPTDEPGDLQRTLEDFLGTVVRLANARAGTVRSLTPEGGQMQLVASVGLSLQACEREPLIGACGVCGDAVHGKGVSVAADAARCGRLNIASVPGDGYTGTVAVPLSFRGETVGVFTLFFDSVNGLRADVLHLLRPLGQLLGLTVENARLERARRESSLAHERQVIAGEIHDSLAQSLTFLRMRMPLLRDAIAQGDPLRARRYCGELDDELASANRRLRELITHFRAGMHAHGLQHALQQLADTFPARTGIALSLENRLPATHLPIEHEVQVFHVIQEAMANIYKHARARQARIALEPSNDGIVITIEDDGKGLSPGVVTALRPGAQSMHFGLQIMQERASSIGAALSFDSPAAGGTRIRMTVPPTGTAATANP